MSDETRPPRILAVVWGRMEVEGIGARKDFKLYPGGGRERGLDETGTTHSPGIQPADVEELLAHGATAVVLSLGMNRRLQVDAWLEEALVLVGLSRRARRRTGVSRRRAGRLVVEQGTDRFAVVDPADGLG